MAGPSVVSGRRHSRRRRDTWVVMFLLFVPGLTCCAPSETSEILVRHFRQPWAQPDCPACDPRCLFNLLITSHYVLVALVSGTNTLRANDKTTRHGSRELKAGSRNNWPGAASQLAKQRRTPWRLTRRQRRGFPTLLGGGLPIGKFVSMSAFMQLESGRESTARLLHPLAAENFVFPFCFALFAFLGPSYPH
jgi:hypothetical protein